MVSGVITCTELDPATVQAADVHCPPVAAPLAAALGPVLTLAAAQGPCAVLVTAPVRALPEVSGKTTF